MRGGASSVFGLGLVLTVACGGSSKSPGGSDGGGGGLQDNPTASFQVPATVAAGAPAVFDASASRASDGSALSYFWEFGGGRRGAGKTIAQVFDDPGARDVVLTVLDARGRTAQVHGTLTVTAAPPPVGTVTAMGRVKELDGGPLAAVSVLVPGSASPALTDALGQVRLVLPLDAPAAVRLSKAGYADQVVRVELPASTGADADFEAVLRPRDAAQTLASAAAGGTLQGRDGAKIVVPPGAFVTPGGSAAQGAVDLAVTPVDVTAPHAGGFPGTFEGLTPDATRSPIVSLGTTEFVPSQGGSPLQLGIGKTAEVELPLYANTLLDGTPVSAGQTIPLWSLDASTGLWIQEGLGTVVASSAPTGFSLRATVSHLSWWNADIGFDPFGPRPRCVYDTDLNIPGGEDHFATATICNMLADIDRGGANLVSPGGRSGALSTPGGRLPGYAATISIPLAGGLRLPSPAGVPLRFIGSMFNGTWFGQTTITGVSGSSPEVLVKMRPVDAAGQGTLVTPPTDLIAQLDTGQVGRYDFLATAGQWARVTVGNAPSSSLQGHVRLLLGATEIAAGDFGGSLQLLRALPGDGRYTVEITGTANTPGAFRFQLQLLGGAQSVALTLPFDATVQVPAFTSYQGAFSTTNGQALLLGLGPNSGGVNWRVRGASGAVLASGQSTQQTVQQIALRGPGSYRVEVEQVQGSVMSLRLTGAQTPWGSVATGPTLASFTDFLDMIADRNGAPVLVSQSQAVVGGVPLKTISLRRFDGTGLVPVGPDVPGFPLPCDGGSGFATVDVTFDASNRPYVVYADLTSSGVGGAGRFNVRRLSAGVWEPVGPNSGILPKQSVYLGGCGIRPAIRILADGSPVVAYRADQDLWIQNLQGDQWIGLGSPTGDSFGGQAGQFELQFDPQGRLVLATSAFATTTLDVFRLSPGAGASWQPLGPSGGALPLPASIHDLSTPRIRFDASGNPIIGLYAGVYVLPGVWTGGTTVARFDGASWTVQDGYFADANSRSSAPYDMGFTLFQGDAIMAWRNIRSGIESTLVQRNTASGWSGLGGGDGTVPQFSPGLGLNLSAAYKHQLLVSGGNLYLGVVENDGMSTQRIRLLRYSP